MAFVMLAPEIPVSVIITTKNEEANIERCLRAVQNFSEVIVVDSQSSDKTTGICNKMRVQVVQFQWNGRYPKKRQWSLDTLALKHDWVFFVDADEVVTPALLHEIKTLFSNKNDHSNYAGFFVKGRYVWRGGVILKHGLLNNKIALLHRKRMSFPIVDDLKISGMGEMEGHYQPVLKQQAFKIGQINTPLLHYAYEDEEKWVKRHERYAAWENGMNAGNLWPIDPILWRQKLKNLLRKIKVRPHIMFVHSYILKCGFLDGRSGLHFALCRYRYYKMIQALDRRL